VDKQTFLILLLSTQSVLVLMDLREGHRTRRESGTRIRPATLWFLGLVVLIYGALQFAGMSLAPTAEALLASAQEFFGRVAGSATTSMSAMAAVGIGAFYFAGLIDYLFHRFASHSRVLWFTHENHHLTNDVALYMPGMSVRPFAVVVMLPTAAATIFTVQGGLTLVGYGSISLLPLLYTVAFVQLSVLGLTHSSFLRRHRWVHSVLSPFAMTSPQEHWLHHTAGSACNYGNFTTCWDRVFGTYLDPETTDASKYRAGLDYDQDYLGTLTWGKAKLGKRTRERYQLKYFCYLEPDTAE